MKNSEKEMKTESVGYGFIEIEEIMSKHQKETSQV